MKFNEIFFTNFFSVHSTSRWQLLCFLSLYKLVHGDLLMANPSMLLNSLRKFWEPRNELNLLGNTLNFFPFSTQFELIRFSLLRACQDEL